MNNDLRIKNYELRVRWLRRSGHVRCDSSLEATSYEVCVRNKTLRRLNKSYSEAGLSNFEAQRAKKLSFEAQREKKCLMSF